MNMANVKIKIRDGLIDRLRNMSGITSDEAFARTIGTSRSTLVDVKTGEREPSLAFAIGIAQAFGLGLSEIVTWETAETTAA
ncbi:helix-turn-helix transcriptional regulator [Corynebacterium silvaticum]|nr:helix-turn-helix transcriptional regulator [Corynebacterium silvaticum]NOM65332.1 helix-turn-helix transcriptional regulator [Corynebacterium silvaticum]NON70970.1 helix-turn-helix transcriptional regulator [Corynebacterium silvaticum]TFA92659.1 XRE family transcriptional regulator [Corynebacterium silvaticum]TFA96344.1 XRE family transcriptional regulator [Corynebacterium silvaticum]